MRALAPVTARVNVQLDVVDVATGALRHRIRAHNRAVDVGLNMLRDAIYGDTIAAVTHCAIGTNGTPAAAGDTTLVAEIFRGELIQRLKGHTTLTLRLVLGSQQLNGETLREWGLFTAGVGGSLYARVTPEPIAKTAAVQVLATWTLSWESDE
jgi:hypothetical protein